MEGGMVFDGSNNITVMLQNERLPPPPPPEALESLWISNSSSSLHGSTSMVDFESLQGEDNAAVRPFFTPLDKEENGGDEEEFDRSFHQPGKKRRLSIDQVQFLERSFEVENKLEPERKVQLAKELNLQPRQVAIWFQNRRARYKTKQLEKDYDFLKSNYEKLKVDFDSLQKENEELKHEVQLLTEKLLQRKKRKQEPEPNEPINSLEKKTQTPNPIAISQSVSNATMVVCKQEDANSAKSDIVDSDSPYYTDGNHSTSLLEPADSSHAFEPDHSDFSQDEEDNFSRSLLRPLPCFPKLENESYIDPSVDSYHLGYPVEDQSFLFWP